jgi:hypothetical protein
VRPTYPPNVGLAFWDVCYFFVLFCFVFFFFFLFCFFEKNLNVIWPMDIVQNSSPFQTEKEKKNGESGM